MQQRGEVLARHLSPDGALIWRVERTLEGDGSTIISFGFEGFLWHLHPEQFEARGRTPEQIALEVTDDVVNDRMVVMTTSWRGEIEHSLLANLDLELSIKIADEQWAFRFWSGRVVSFDDLVDGTVKYKPLVEDGMPPQPTNSER